MNLYTDDNKHTTLKGLKFKDKKAAKESIQKIEDYFDNMYSKQKIPAYSNKKTLPKKYLETKSEAKRYYKIQKMYRVLGLLNRAKSMLERVDSEDIEDSVEVFEKWMKKYKNSVKGGSKKIVDCCGNIKRSKKCRRKSDDKIFNLPRRFSRKQCLSGKIRGFSMKSSCAPYNDC